MGKLTAVAVKAAMANPGTYQDGDGLVLRVDKRGGAYWVLRLQRDGKRQDIGLGSAKQMTLAEARQKATVLRKAVKVDHRDVLAEKKDEAAAKVTFRAAATQYHSENEAGWKSTVYARQWLASLENYAFPKLGDMPTGSISSADIIAVLTPIWQEIPDTARQVRNRICAVLDYSHAKGWRSREAPSGNGSLKAGRGLPRQVKVRENRKAMPYVALPGFLTALRRKPSFGRLALELLILTGVRSQEVRLATWSEFDLESRLWTIPAEHMKRNKAHIVPLSDEALAVLAKADALRMSESDVVFPGVAGKPMSDMTLLKVLRDMSEPYHVHGFRSAFTDWAANEGIPDAVVEAALAHKTPDAVQAAYRRTTYLGTPDQPGARVKLMAAWGRYCLGVATGADKAAPPA
ncbi:MAG: integrase [Sphingomonadales bacterium RIFCSPHIGHO2_01_FULL_65_20]|uniref:Site-specific integrase n=2 Tax=Sphingomonadaceae TaxID=41297 RepID=A0A494W887_9SPHN|nr:MULTISPECIES: site-specific integrase [Sphingomonadaceae]MDF8334411.1 tyrosine-type recombinase/integrase [Novosphingobium cyanobacteriorum]MDP3700357.1 tyrosine-type recombinase/integrase [Hylemonella sp.]OHC96142.1 MAG: integrase [Sphingomonadales bacterium RIFCSPHIGHO2_01_FULL_65_20]BBD96602.1 site-specific integrase [Sphingobium amiense]